MKKIFLTILVLLSSIFFTACSKNSKVSLENDALKQVYYTQVNMWYENKATYDSDSTNKTFNDGSLAFASDYTIASTNYSYGNLLPINSQIKIIKLDTNKIFFEHNKKLYAFVRTKHSKHRSLEQLFKRTFGVNKVDLENLQNKEAIKSGKIEVGMSKEEIIYTRGYPPEHKTRTLSSNHWYYWSTKHNSQKFIFENNNLKLIEE